MAQQILMPALSPTMTEGKLAKWCKGEGDALAAGDVIAEIETDKATMEFEAVDDGILGRIVVAEGSEGVPVNTLIAVLLEEGEDASAVDSLLAGDTPLAGQSTAPVAADTPSPPPPPPTRALPEKTAPPPRERIFASPLARRMAKDAGIDLAVLTGSGPRGRIVKVDVEKGVLRKKAASPPPAVAAPPPPPTQIQPPLAGAVPRPMPWQTYTEEPNSGMRKTIARRLTESKQTVPHFYLTVDIELDALLEMRKQLNGRDGADYKLSVNDFIIKACALALKKVPAANAMWTDTAILRFDAVDISVAVATDAGLLTPVIRNADQKGLSTISSEMKSLAQSAREGKLKPEQFQGGGFTLSNLGMFGVRDFAAIINPPQSCILAVGAGEQRAVVRGGALAVRTMMTCTLSVDHRSVDGAVGATFLATMKPLLEDPLQLML